MFESGPMEVFITLRMFTWVVFFILVSAKARRRGIWVEVGGGITGSEYPMKRLFPSRMIARHDPMNPNDVQYPRGTCVSCSLDAMLLKASFFSSHGKLESEIFSICSLLVLGILAAILTV